MKERQLETRMHTMGEAKSKRKKRNHKKRDTKTKPTGKTTEEGMGGVEIRR